MGVQIMKCPHCNWTLVPFDGPEDAPILLVGEFPGDEEVEAERPFVGKTGKILRTEIARAHIRWSQCRTGNLWQHKKNAECDMGWHIASLYTEFVKHKYVLMMGSEFAGVFYPGKVTASSSLVYEHNGVLYVPTMNPASVPKSGVGELQLAIQRILELSEGEWKGEPYRFESFGTRPQRAVRSAGRGSKKRGGDGSESSDDG